MTRLEITGSGVAQYTKLEKLSHRQKMGLALPDPSELERMVRSNDQDKYIYDPVRGIFAVADGVGGMPFGAEAAQAACDAFYDELCAEDHEFDASGQAFYIAQHALAQIIHMAAAETGGFTTFTGIYRVDETHLAYLHAGDSELSRRRRDNVRRITSVQHQSGNRLTSYMGGSGRGVAELALDGGLASMYATEWGLLRVQTGDRYILATDGVTDATPVYHTTNEWWVEQTDRQIGAQALADFLVQASPRIDDSTAVVVDF
jgi:serine/threonine protein phosphatase PrpC